MVDFNRMRTRVLTRAARAIGRRAPIFALERRNWDHHDGSPPKFAARGAETVLFAWLLFAPLVLQPVPKQKVDVFSGSRIILAKQQLRAHSSALVSVECDPEC